MALPGMTYCFISPTMIRARDTTISTTDPITDLSRCRAPVLNVCHMSFNKDDMLFKW
jgi:hypothetical protein